MLKISQKEILNRLYFDNPWWTTSEIEERFQELPTRYYFKSFLELVKQKTINRALVLMGPRRVGKTVMVYQAIAELLKNNVPAKNILYASLETPIYTGLSLEKIINIFVKEFNKKRNSELYIVFDEIQYLPQWEVHLKSLVDSFPSYKFIATGSAAAALKLKSKESGAGRFTDFLLPPLTFAEYLNFINKEKKLIQEELPYSYTSKNIKELNIEFINYLNYGGYPEAVFSTLIQKDSSRYIKSDIIDKVLLRDLPSLYGINDVQELNKLFTTLAYNSGNEISLDGLSKSSGVSKNTIKKYLEYLEAAFLIKIVHRIDDNSKQFKRATYFKVYLSNPSMRAALFGPISEENEAMGAITETAIYSQWFHSREIDTLHYARWKKGEVDLVDLDVVTQKPRWCVEIKWSDLVFEDNRKIKAIVEFCQKNEMKTAMVTTKATTNNKVIDDIKISFRPSALYTYTIGANILKSNTQIPI